MTAPTVRRRAAADVDPDRRAAAGLDAPALLDEHVLAVDGAAAWTTERWARAMFEDRRPLPARLLASGPLGLVLTGPRPPGRVAGWGIAASTARRLVLTRDLVVAREAVVIDVEDDAVAVLTAIALRPAPVRLATPPLDLLHRMVTPAVMRRAHAQLVGSGPR